MEKRTKQLLEQQQKSVLQPKRRESGFSFETIKDLTNKQNDEVKRETKSTEIEESVHENKFNSNLEMNKSMKINIANKKEINDTPMYKNKDDIEKELFDEFNNEPKYELNLENHYESNDKSEGNNENFKDTVEDKLPKVSIDEYMKNFNENEFPNEDLNSLFKNDDSFFPNIPV